MSTPLFQLDPSLIFAGWVNPKIANQQRLSFPAQYNQVIQGFPSDLLAGTVVLGVPYNSYTFTQQQILAYYAEVANVFSPANVQYPADLPQTLATNPGPDAVWNLSYAGWGLDTTQPMSPLLKVVTGVQQGSGVAVSVLIEA